MTDADAQRNALIIAGDCIDVESSTQLEVRYRGLPEEERHQIEAHLERLSMELYERAGALRVGETWGEDGGGGTRHDDQAGHPEMRAFP